MKRYELLTIISASLTDEEKEQTIAKYTQLIESNDGKMQVVNKWGMKKLAYPINYKTDGYYVLFEFDGEPTLPKIINDLMKIDEAIVRSFCLVKDA